MRIIRLIVSLSVALVIVLATGCKKENNPPITGSADTTDTAGADTGLDTGFVYQADTAPSTLGDGYIGLLKVTKSFQGYPVVRTDTVVLYISGTSAFTYKLEHLSHASDLCDSYGKLAFGKGGLTVFDSRSSSGGFCDSLRVPYGPLKSVYTESTLVMDSSRLVVTGTGAVEKVSYKFDLAAFNLFANYLGELSIIEYRFGQVDTLVDSVGIVVTDSLFSMTTYSDSDRVCDAGGRIEFDVSQQKLRISVDSLITGANGCDQSLSPDGNYEADFRYDGMILKMTRVAPIPGSVADSIKYRFDLAGS